MEKNPNFLRPYVQKSKQIFLARFIILFICCLNVSKNTLIFFDSVPHFTVTVTACFSCQREKTVFLSIMFTSAEI